MCKLSMDYLTDTRIINNIVIIIVNDISVLKKDEIEIHLLKQSKK